MKQPRTITLNNAESWPSWMRCRREMDALKRLQTENAAELDAASAILDCVFKAEL